MNSASTRVLRSLALVLVAGLAGAGCEVQNIASVTMDDTNPLRLVRGASYMTEVFANTYGNIIFGATGEGGNGEVSDPTAMRFFERNFTSLHEARVLASMAIDRAEELGQDDMLGLANIWHGWINVRLAEVWGDQPLGDGIVHPAEELFTTALANFAAANGDAVDSVRHAALAGEARVHWIRGRDPVDATNLNAAITAAETVLAENPSFRFAPIPKRVTYLRNMQPSEAFADIPMWTADPNLPQGIELIDADELRLIIAEAHVLLDRLDDAKAAVKSTDLLPVNHIGLAGRDPEGAPLTPAEIDAYVDPMDAQQLMFVITELRRENIFTYGRRNVGPKEDGTMFPLQYPQNG